MQESTGPCGPCQCRRHNRPNNGSSFAEDQLSASLDLLFFLFQLFIISVEQDASCRLSLPSSHSRWSSWRLGTAGSETITYSELLQDLTLDAAGTGAETDVYVYVGHGQGSPGGFTVPGLQTGSTDLFRETKTFLPTGQWQCVGAVEGGRHTHIFNLVWDSSAFFPAMRHLAKLTHASTSPHQRHYLHHQSEKQDLEQKQRQLCTSRGYKIFSRTLVKERGRNDICSGLAGAPEAARDLSGLPA